MLLAFDKEASEKLPLLPVVLPNELCRGLREKLELLLPKLLLGFCPKALLLFLNWCPKEGDVALKGISSCNFHRVSEMTPPLSMSLTAINVSGFATSSVGALLKSLGLVPVVSRRKTEQREKRSKLHDR